MLAIRMTRHGAKKRPFFHIVVADSRSPRDGRFIEKLGTYNPLLPREHEQRITLDKERIAHWLKVGAQPSDRVARFLATAELMSPGRWRLRRLLRGQLGTEDAIGDPLPAGARVVLLDAAVTALPISEADMGLPWTWRVGPTRVPVGRVADGEIVGF